MSGNEQTGEEIVTYSELLEQIDDEEAELDRERALYGNCDTDTCTYPQVDANQLSSWKKRTLTYSGIRKTTSVVRVHDML
jgi:hypothetical protein